MADKKAPSTYVEMEMVDGSTVKMTLNFARLRMVKVKKPDVYDNYAAAIRFMMEDESGIPDEFQTIDVLYAGYLCSNPEHIDELMSYDDFLELLPNSHTMIYEKYSLLYKGDEGKK
jgi:hypothetical protein